MPFTFQERISKRCFISFSFESVLMVGGMGEVVVVGVLVLGIDALAAGS